MDFINYSLTNIIVFFGLIIGIILAYIAKEELKDGKKYFILLQNILLAIIFFFCLFFYKTNLILTIAISLAVFFSLYFYLNTEKRQRIRYIDYGLLGIFFYYASKNLNLFLLQSALIFIYGFPTGSLLINIKKKNFLEIILKNISFIIISLVLFFIIK